MGKRNHKSPCKWPAELNVAMKIAHATIFIHITMQLTTRNTHTLTHSLTQCSCLFSVWNLDLLYFNLDCSIAFLQCVTHNMFDLCLFFFFFQFSSQPIRTDRNQFLFGVEKSSVCNQMFTVSFFLF